MKIRPKWVQSYFGSLEYMFKPSILYYFCCLFDSLLCMVIMLCYSVLVIINFLLLFASSFVLFVSFFCSLFVYYLLFLRNCLVHFFYCCKLYLYHNLCNFQMLTSSKSLSYTQTEWGISKSGGRKWLM